MSHSLSEVLLFAYTFIRLLWMLGSVIAAAGMQVYIIWGSVRRFLSRITTYLTFFCSGPTSQRRGEELPRTSLSQTQATNYIHIRCQRSTARYATFQLSTPTSFLTYRTSLRCGKLSRFRRIHSRILRISSFPIACHIFSCPPRRLCLPYRSSLITRFAYSCRNSSTERVGIHEDWHSSHCCWDWIHRSQRKPSARSAASRKF